MVTGPSEDQEGSFRPETLVQERLGEYRRSNCVSSFFTREVSQGDIEGEGPIKTLLISLLTTSKTPVSSTGCSQSNRKGLFPRGWEPKSPRRRIIRKDFSHNKLVFDQKLCV